MTKKPEVMYRFQTCMVHCLDVFSLECVTLFCFGCVLENVLVGSVSPWFGGYSPRFEISALCAEIDSYTWMLSAALVARPSRDDCRDRRLFRSVLVLQLAP